MPPKLPSEPCPSCSGTGRRVASSFGHTLKSLRKHHRLRLVDVAQYLELRIQQVADYESGRRHVPPELAEAWLEMYERMRPSGE